MVNYTCKQHSCYMVHKASVICRKITIASICLAWNSGILEQYFYSPCKNCENHCSRACCGRAPIRDDSSLGANEAWDLVCAPQREGRLALKKVV